MPVIKIPKQYLIEQDEASITVDVPETVLALWQQEDSAITADLVREKLAALPIAESDIQDAVTWARQEA